MSLDEKVTGVFKNYPGYKQLYATTDGQIFLKKVNADNHALTLETMVIIYNADEMGKAPKNKDRTIKKAEPNQNNKT